MYNNVPRNPPVCSFALFLIISLTPFINKPESSRDYFHDILSKNPFDYPILSNWVFDNFILAEELFAKALRGLETCVLVNNNL